ncbi:MULTISPECIES: BglG family transcription antiterminator LicT [unclassified Vagococcus]|uniref:BglG family transcription antiterminator LicT n=1 Tax=unclassified Vagococcus TaxID=2648499 RepID=UPI001F515077|nr:PRD domain-containing protein [Vagococcus sp. CY52-2]MCI0130913.1 PRD domain-containing protein [Vagococcus sp. CY53-2]UNM89300.1 PRD domain-containing protein [Vagococcus sp. CY52-2]
MIVIKIIKILNNNAFISQDDTGNEVVVMGVGIAFGKKNGQIVEPSNRYKIFSNINSKIIDRFKNVFSDMPEDYLEITERLIFVMEKEYGKKIDDIIYVSLTEHLHGAVERINKGIKVANPLLMDIKRLFKDEFEVGMLGVKEVNQRFEVAFSEDEAAYIAQHLINGQLDNLVDINDMSKLMQEIINIIKFTFRIEFNEESIYYYRFVTHLKFFAQRVIDKQVYTSENDDMFDLFKEKYVESYECVVKIDNYLSKNYHYHLNSDEQLYLLLHIEKITKNAKITSEEG